MRRRGGPNVVIAFSPGGPLTAQLYTVDSPGGPVSWGSKASRHRSIYSRRRTLCKLLESILDNLASRITLFLSV